MHEMTGSEEKMHADVDDLSTPSLPVTEVPKTDVADTEEHTSPSPSTFKEEASQMSKWRYACLSSCLCLCLFLSFIDSSIVSTALFTIGTDFNSLTNVFWVASAYTLADVGFAVPFAAMADIIGRFRAYLLALVIYIVFSIACGFARTLNELIAFRTLQGLGASGLYALTVVIWPEMSTPGLKRWLGAGVGAVLAIAGAAGPLLGGAITSHATWRWIFWFTAPVGAFALVGFVLSWPRGSHVRHHEVRGVGALDWVGCLLLLGACVLPTFAFQEAGNDPDIWGHALFLAPFLLGLFIWGLLIAWERYISKRRSWHMVSIFPGNLLKTLRYTAAAVNTLLTGFAFFVVIYNIPLRLQGVNGKSAVEAGIALLPLLGSSALGSFVSGGMSFKKDMLGYTSIAGFALMAIGTGLLSTLPDSSHVPSELYGFQVFAGLGFGLTVSSASMLANFECELEHHAVAQGIVSQARVFGGSLGIAASSAILGRGIQTQQVRIAGAGGDGASLLSQVGSLTASEQAAVRRIYSNSFREAMIVTCVIACIAFLAALGTWDRHTVGLRDRIAAQEQRESDRIARLAREQEEGDDPSRRGRGALAADATSEKAHA